MSDEGFIRLVTDGLGRLDKGLQRVEEKVDVLTNEIGLIKASNAVEKVRRDRLGQPLADWGIADSMALKTLVEREKRQQPSEEQREHEAARDRTILRWRERAVLASALAAVLQSLFNPVGQLWHLIHKTS